MNIKSLVFGLIVISSTALANQEQPISPPPPAVVTQVSDVNEEVKAQIHAWADAWSKRDFSAYSGFYGAGFEPARGLSRSQWEKVRKARIVKRPRLTVEIEDITVESIAQDQVIAKFKQKYWSKSYRDKVVKTLTFVKVDDSWLIVKEESSKCTSNTNGWCKKGFKNKKLKRSRRQQSI